MSDERYDWYFDFISPFAYLQWRRLWRDQREIATRLQPKPLLLAGLLNHWGQLGPAELPGKRRHTYRHVLWQARAEGVPMTFQSSVPTALQRQGNFSELLNLGPAYQLYDPKSTVSTGNGQ